MTNDTPSSIIAQLQDSLVCGSCKAAKLLVWEKAELDESFGEAGAQYAVTTDACVYAVHCDYFRRRIEAPNRLLSCAAFQAADGPPIEASGHYDPDGHLNPDDLPNPRDPRDRRARLRERAARRSTGSVKTTDAQDPPLR